MDAFPAWLRYLPVLEGLVILVVAMYLPFACPREA
jgi:hypothetical protein